MFAQLFVIIFPVLACAVIGLVWAKSNKPFDTDTIGQLVMTIGAPCLVISTLSQTHLDIELFWQMAWITMITFIGFLILGAVVIKISSFPAKTYLPPTIFMNTGNMGLPLCLFAFGEQGLAYGIVFFMVITVIHFSLGLAFVSGEGVYKTLIKNPLVHSVWIAILLQVTQCELPIWLMNTINLLGQFSIPLMLLALGVSLASLAVNNVITSLKLSIVRVFGGCAIAWMVCEIFGIEGSMRGALILQSSMPAAVFNYLIAARYRRDPETVASVVVISTLLAFVALPGVLWLVL